MNDFLDHLLARNLPGVRGEQGTAGQPQTWLRPRTRSRFESMSTGMAADQIATAEPPILLDDDAEPQSTAARPTSATKLPRDQVRAVQDRTDSSAQFDQRDDRSAARESGKEGRATAVIARPAYRTRLAAERVAAPTAVTELGSDHSASMTTLGTPARREGTPRDLPAVTALRRQPLPSQATLPTAPAETERYAQGQPQRHAEREQFVSVPTDSFNAQRADLKRPPALNAVTPAALDAALRAGLQTLATAPHDRTRPRAPTGDNVSRSEPPRQTIQVSIGRIEIRATHSGALTGASARKEKSGPQPIGLDEYLRQRAGGARE